MYAELTLILKKPIERAAAIAALNKMIGGNAVNVSTFVEDTPLAEFADRALCAEQVSVKADVVYFMQGLTFPRNFVFQG